MNNTLIVALTKLFFTWNLIHMLSTTTSFSSLVDIHLNCFCIVLNSLWLSFAGFFWAHFLQDFSFSKYKSFSSACSSALQTLCWFWKLKQVKTLRIVQHIDCVSACVNNESRDFKQVVDYAWSFVNIASILHSFCFMLLEHNSRLLFQRMMKWNMECD